MNTIQELDDNINKSLKAELAIEPWVYHGSTGNVDRYHIQEDDIVYAIIFKREKTSSLVIKEDGNIKQIYRPSISNVFSMGLKHYKKHKEPLCTLI